MGTRHLILVYYKGEYRIAQYGQWDGYPDGQGIVVLAFANDPANLEKLKAALDTPGRIFDPSREQHEKWASEGDAKRVHPSLHRDTSAQILTLVSNATEPVPIVTEVEFIADTLFCEWAYVIDLDIDMLEVYGVHCGVRGQNGVQQTRFGAAEGVQEGGGPALIAAWPLHAPPKKAEFLDACSMRPEEDEQQEEMEVEEEKELEAM